jgi:hypothetical protein
VVIEVLGLTFDTGDLVRESHHVAPRPCLVDATEIDDVL